MAVTNPHEATQSPGSSSGGGAKNNREAKTVTNPHQATQPTDDGGSTGPGAGGPSVSGSPPRPEQQPSGRPQRLAGRVDRPRRRRSQRRRWWWR